MGDRLGTPGGLPFLVSILTLELLFELLKASGVPRESCISQGAGWKSLRRRPAEARQAFMGENLFFRNLIQRSVRAQIWTKGAFWSAQSIPSVKFGFGKFPEICHRFFDFSKCRYPAPRRADCEASRRAGRLKFGKRTALGWTQLWEKSALSGTPVGPRPAAPKTAKLKKSGSRHICGGRDAAIMDFF